jgi:hypothetical protein
MRKPAWGWIVAAGAVCLGLAGVVVAIADAGGPHVVAGVKSPPGDVASGVVIVLLLILSAGIGGLVASRRPDTPIGWLLLVTPLCFGLVVLTDALGWHYLLADRAVTHRVAYLLTIDGWAWIPAVTSVFVFLPLLFPTGTPLSPRWGSFTRAAAIVMVVFVVAVVFAPGVNGSYPVRNPLGTGRVVHVIQWVCFGLLAPISIASITSLALRYRRARGVERQQIKWVWAAGALLLVSFVLASVLDNVFAAADAIFFVGLLGVFAAVAVAVLRYRLYDIALVVNRTLVYGSLTAALAAVYLACVLLLQQLLASVASGSSLAVAVSTLAVAGLFGPLRSRIQAVVDRRFYRRKYDAALTLEAFSARLRDELDLDSLSRELRTVLDETMQPSHISLWLRPSGE